MILEKNSFTSAFHMDEIFDVIIEERKYQDRKWGGKSHDIYHSIADFVLFMEAHIDKAKEAIYEGDHDPRHEIRKVAALAIAFAEIYGMPSREMEGENIID